MDKINNNSHPETKIELMRNSGFEVDSTGEWLRSVNLVTCEYEMAASDNGRDVCDSISSTLSVIMDALSQPNINIIGVYGSSADRKGRVVEKIKRRVNRDNLFDVVVMASVMERPDLKRIQVELGNKLDLQLHENATVEGRAISLCERIKMEDRILVILDDIWSGINLARIGIPFGNDHNGCKILLISHSQEVLSNQMHTQLEFSV